MKRHIKTNKMITTSQVKFMIQSAMVIKNICESTASEMVNEYIKAKGWIVS